mmetsp:Transcript_15660/g.11031  ORF Transcript_15660/g.11031 Transcript_15660/m.11031 type:complete len:106 (-) Transcript_15660:62-379(-)
MQPLKEFYAEINKSGDVRMQVVAVNCDKREKEFKEHLAELPQEFLSVPFEHEEALAKLEDIGEAETIPRLSIIHVTKTLKEAALKDAKMTVLRNQSMEQAVKELE